MNEWRFFKSTTHHILFQIAPSMTHRYYINEMKISLDNLKSLVTNKTPKRKKKSIRSSKKVFKPKFVCCFRYYFFFQKNLRYFILFPSFLFNIFLFFFLSWCSPGMYFFSYFVSFLLRKRRNVGRLGGELSSGWADGMGLLGYQNI